MFGTMYTSWSGLLANSTALNVAGNNLANINTVGFKKGSATFSQLMSDQARVNGNNTPMQIGLGARASAISPIFTQGSFVSTGVSTNVALEGRGFFQAVNNGQTMYTRAGNFGFNAAGFLVAQSGARVQGYTEADANGRINTNGAVGDILIDYEATNPPRATDIVRYVTNLKANAEPGEEVTSDLTVYDTNGDERVIRVTFTNTENVAEWTYSFEQVGSQDEFGTLAGDMTGTFTFDENGNLATYNGMALDDPNFIEPVLTINGLPNGAEDMNINWDLVQPTGPNGENQGLITSLGARSISSTVFQNGFGSGDLVGVTFDRSGTLLGQYSNGETVELARLAIATFQNNQGLKQTGSGFFRQTGASGEPVLNPDSALVLGGTLEASNVDIAGELTSLIVFQRAYQGNARSVTTADQVLQESINLKR